MSDSKGVILVGRGSGSHAKCALLAAVACLMIGVQSGIVHADSYTCPWRGLSSAGTISTEFEGGSVSVSLGQTTIGRGSASDYSATIGFWSGAEWPLASVEEGFSDETPPAMFSLGHWRPNPFSVDTCIRLAIPEHSTISLDVYDVSGRIVTEIVNSHMAPGHYYIRWDGRDSNRQRLSPGIYFLRLRVGARNTARKVVLVR
jgi:hypothetical protein